MDPTAPTNDFDDDPDPAPRRSRVAPLAVLAGAVASGVVVDRAFEPCGTATWGALALIALLGATLTGRVRRRLAGSGSGPDRFGWANVPVGLAWLALGGAWHHERWSDRPGDDLAATIRASGWGPGERRLAWVRGVVAESATFRPGSGGPTDPGRTRLVLALRSIRDERAGLDAWRPASGSAQVFIGGDRSDLAAGRAVEAAGLIGLVDGPLNPGELDLRPLLRADGIELRLGVDGPGGIRDDPDGPDWSWTRRLGAIRAWSFRQLAAGLDPATLPLGAALLLGRREAVAPEVNDAFGRTGTTHLLAISGLHLQMLALALGFAARAAGLRARAVVAVVALGVVGYAALVGFAPSVVRSAAMTLGICLAAWRDRCATAGNLLGGAVLATVAWNPGDLFDVGCQLSFLAVAALIWLVPAVLSYDAPALLPLDVVERQAESWWRARRRVGLAHLRAGLIASATVWLAAWPLVALRFHLLSPVAILLNLPLVPLTSLALLLAGLTLALAGVWAPLAAPFAWACGLCLQGTEALVRWGVALPGGHTFTPGPPSGLVALFYLALAGATVALAARWPRAAARRWWCGALALGLTLALWPLVPSRPEHATADVWAVGHGLSVLVRSPSGPTLLYDAGRMGDPHVGRRVIAPALWSQGVRRIDHLVLSHADLDHFGGVPDLLDRFEVGTLRVPPGFDDARNPAAARLLLDARRRGVAVLPIAAGDRIDLGSGLVLDCWHPRPGATGGTDNARSVVLAATVGDRRLLLTGDLERDGLAALLARPAPEAPVDALLSPHHGGRTANPPSLFAWARPRLVAVSQRPPVPGARDALGPLESPEAGTDPTPLLRTWRDGAIQLRWLPDRLAATAFLRPEPAGPAPLGRMVRAGLGFDPARLGGLGISALGIVLGLVLALAVVTTEWGAWALVAPGRKPDRAPAGEAATLPRRAITARGLDGALLVGDYFAADSDGPSDRTILLLHGLAEDRRAFEVRVAHLVAAGWNAAAVDARGSGASGGTRVSFGGREADDVRAWLDALTDLQAAERPEGQAPRFAAWGRSMGSATALRASTVEPRLRALVLEAPYADLRTAVAGVLRRMRVPGALAPLVLARARRLAGVSLDRPRPIDLAPLVPAPTLVVHGVNDPIAPLGDAQNLAAQIGTGPQGDRNSLAGFIAVPGAGHADAFAIGGDALADSVVAFLNRAIPPA